VERLAGDEIDATAEEPRELVSEVLRTLVTMAWRATKPTRLWVVLDRVVVDMFGLLVR